MFQVHSIQADIKFEDPMPSSNKIDLKIANSNINLSHKLKDTS